ncbi:hypothetical protein Arub01_13140 [Actinomadura rubrobrunea]|uniref:Uncharacterized protein n=1 Tax=Actinomadura rubrobrunea TaxID=115335 RepID=A0A9W6PRC1_9ACTN|nr:hypothetical protein Arub01_13140 [Actinomadura rubrobrunea]
MAEPLGAASAPWAVKPVAATTPASTTAIRAGTLINLPSWENAPNVHSSTL